MKNMIYGLIMILLSSCSLEENIKKEEEKDYTDVVHPVDMADYEFEQRLNSFYESEPIKNEELYGLYKGEFPDGEKNPQKLRIHWKDARELALAELELQRPMQAGWEEGDISERPVLRLDRDGGDFYRYYEYRVVKGLKFLGAIRIPAYRRTENFATAEVHRYSDDQKTYTIYPTSWGNKILSELNLESSEEKYFQLANKISQALQTFIDNNELPQETIRQYYQEKVQLTGLVEEMVQPISDQQAEQYIRNYVYENLTPNAIKKWKNDNKEWQTSLNGHGSGWHIPYASIHKIDKDIQDATADKWVDQYLPTYAQGLEKEQEKFVNDYIVDYLTYNASTLLGEEIAKSTLFAIEETFYQTISNMSYNRDSIYTADSQLAEKISQQYWQAIEQQIEHNNSRAIITIGTAALIKAIISITIDSVTIGTTHGWDKVSENIDSIILNAILSAFVPGKLPSIKYIKPLIHSIVVAVGAEFISKYSDQILPESGNIAQILEIIGQMIVSRDDGFQMFGIFVKDITVYIYGLVTSIPINQYPSGNGSSGANGALGGGNYSSSQTSPNNNSHQSSSQTQSSAQNCVNGYSRANCSDPAGHGLGSQQARNDSNKPDSGGGCSGNDQGGGCGTG